MKLMKLAISGWTYALLFFCATDSRGQFNGTPPQQAPQGPWEAPEEEKAIPNPVPASAESLKRGRAIYEENCATCHGNEGKGDGSSREFIPMNPANLSDPAFASKKTDGEWYWKITTGRTPMNAYEDYISEEDRWNVINYIRTFSAETGRAAAPQVVAAANAGQSHPKSDSPAPVKSASIPNRAAEDEKDEPAEQEHSIHWAIVLGVAAFLAVDSIVLIIIFGRKPKAGDGSQNS